MAPQPPPGTGAPTGNALTDANSGAPKLPEGRVNTGSGTVGQLTQQQADVLNSLNATMAQVASDCLWPPSSQVTIPIIPGVYSQSFQVPCLLSYSEARAFVGAGILVGGVLVIGWGLSILAAAAVLGPVLSAVGISRGTATRRATTGSAAPAASEVALAA
jgi:hypothetical protein